MKSKVEGAAAASKAVCYEWIGSPLPHLSRKIEYSVFEAVLSILLKNGVVFLEKVGEGHC